MVPLVPMLSISLDRASANCICSPCRWPRRANHCLLVTDRIGRRLVPLGGFAVFVGASILLIFVDTLGVMIFLRFMQAVGVASARSLRGASSATTYPRRGTESLRTVDGAMGFTPVIAPLWGYLASLLGTASVFVVLALLGAGLLLLCVNHSP